MVSTQGLPLIGRWNRFLGRVAILLSLVALVEVARPLAWTIVLLAGVYTLFALLSAAGYLHWRVSARSSAQEGQGGGEDLFDAGSRDYQEEEVFRFSKRSSQGPFALEEKEEETQKGFQERFGELWDALRGGRWEEALSQASRLAQERPEEAFVYTAMAWSLNQLGRHREALKLAQKASTLAPEDPLSQAALAWAWGGIGAFDRAIEPAQKLAILRPEEGLAWEMLVWILGNLGRYGEAVEAARRAMELRPEWPTARYNLGLALLKNGDRKGALEQYQILRKTAPELAEKLAAELKRG